MMRLGWEGRNGLDWVGLGWFGLGFDGCEVGRGFEVWWCSRVSVRACGGRRR